MRFITGPLRVWRWREACSPEACRTSHSRVASPTSSGPLASFGTAPLSLRTALAAAGSADELVTLSEAAGALMDGDETGAFWANAEAPKPANKAPQARVL